MEQQQSTAGNWADPVVNPDSPQGHLIRSIALASAEYHAQRHGELVRAGRRAAADRRRSSDHQLATTRQKGRS